MAASRLVVAVVDDEAEVCKALHRLLSASNFSVATFASGQAFLDSLPASRPDCLLLDLQMPNLSGHEVQCELARAGVRLPVVIITAYDEADSRARCLKAGATAYLLKPVDEQALLSAIAQAVGDAS